LPCSIVISLDEISLEISRVVCLGIDIVFILFMILYFVPTTSIVGCFSITAFNL
jgi:hypothetical protein